MNLVVGEERENEVDEEENVKKEVILNPPEERHFRAIFKIGKRTKFEVPKCL